MAEDQLVQQNELNDQIKGNEIKLQEANDQCETKINKFSELLNKILTKLTDIQETIVYNGLLVIKVDGDLVDLNNTNNSYNDCRRIKTQMRVDLKQVMEKEFANKQMVNSVMQDIDESYLYND